MGDLEDAELDQLRTVVASVRSALQDLATAQKSAMDSADGLEAQMRAAITTYADGFDAIARALQPPE